MNRIFARAAVTLAVVGAAIGMSATLASAHVTIDTLGAVEKGSFAKLGFSVPNERSDAGTTKVEVQMPQDTPLTFVSVQPKQGWDVTTTMRTLDEPVEAFGTSIAEVVDTITWTATGDTQIGPGQFELFWVSAGAMPTDVDSLAFPTLQTYSSGEEVAWIQDTPAGGEEPEHPAPTVQLVDASENGSAEVVVGDDSPGPAAVDVPATSDSDDDNTLAIIALVVGGAALLAAIGGIVLTARTRASGSKVTG